MYEIKLLSTGILPTNTYVLWNKDSRKCIVIDPAYDEKVDKYISENNLVPVGVLLTHGHFDHCGGVKPIVDKFGVSVYGSEKDALIAQNASKNEWGVFCYDCKITNFVDHLDDVKIDNFEFKVLHTPGHTPGGVCYFIDGVMFSGDTLFRECIGRIDLPGGDYFEMINSLAKIADIEENYRVLAGHEGETDLYHEFKYNPYLVALKQRR